MTITVDTVYHYAKLANLHFEDAEAELLAGQLEKILGYVDKLGELDLEGVPATRHVLHAPPELREDEHRESLGPELALKNAPDTESNHFLVPKVIAVK
jgi:aspartyl-tRNA(Asn)/glutamyl-tRNA(Gln) amidotransferase subunit C